MLRFSEETADYIRGKLNGVVAKTLMRDLKISHGMFGRIADQLERWDFGGQTYYASGQEDLIRSLRDAAVSPRKDNASARRSAWDEDRPVSIKEASRHLGVSRDRLARRVEAHRIPTWGERGFVRRTDVQSLPFDTHGNKLPDGVYSVADFAKLTGVAHSTLVKLGVPRSPHGGYDEASWRYLSDHIVKTADPPHGLRRCPSCKRSRSFNAAVCRECDRSQKAKTHHELTLRTDAQIELDYMRLHPDGMKRCRNGHLAEQSAFHKSRNKVDGRHSECKACASAAASRRKNGAVVGHWVAAGIDPEACWHCGRNLTVGGFGDDRRDLEHFEARLNGGTDHVWNLVPSCGSCNSTKHSKVDWEGCGPLPPRVRTLYAGKAGSKTIREFVAERHYSGSCQPGVERHGLFDTGVLVGAAVYNNGNRRMQEAVFGAPFADKVLHLHRLVTEPGQPTGQLLARSLKLLDVERHWAVVTYADPSRGHLGKVYQATNAIYTGVTAGNIQFRMPDGSVVNGRGAPGKTHADRRAWGRSVGATEQFPRKHRYVYLLRSERALRKQGAELLLPRLPYPR